MPSHIKHHHSRQKHTSLERKWEANYTQRCWKRRVASLWHWFHFISCVVMLNNTSLKERRIGVMENSNAWRGKAGKRDAKTTIDADHSGSCFPHGGGTKAGFGGPAEGVLKISASKIFDQWLTAGTHEGSHARTRTPARHSPVVYNEAELNRALQRSRQQDSVVEVQDTLLRTHDHSVTHTRTRTHRHWAAATETQTGYSPHPCGAQPVLPCILANVWEPLTQSEASEHS